MNEITESGYFKCLVTLPSNPEVLFACGRVDLLRSTDGGETWHVALHGSVDGVEFSASHPDRVFVQAAGENVFLSLDTGRTWETKSLSQALVTSLAVHPLDPEVVLLGSGLSFELPPYYDPILRGIYKTDDGGDSWTTSTEDDIYDANAILFDTDNPDTVYAGVMPRTGGTMLLRRSPDGGATWEQLFPKGSSTSISRLVMTPAGYGERSLYAMTNDGKLFRSADRGDSWTELGIPNSATGLLAMDVEDPNILYLGGTDSLHRSMDGGVSWSSFAISTGDGAGCAPVDIATQAASSSLSVLCQGHSGVLRSDDRGESWSVVGRLVHSPAQFLDLAVDPTDPTHIFATVVDPDSTLAVSHDAGLTWSFVPDAPPNLGTVDVDPNDPSTVWVGLPGVQDRDGVHAFRSEDSGATWREYVVGAIRSYMQITGFLVHPENSDYFLAGSRTVNTWNNYSDLWRSTYGPRNWDRVGDGGTAFALDPADPGTVYHGKGRPGHMYRTTNVWETWSTTEITPDGGIGDVFDIAVDLESTVYVAASDGLWTWNGASWSMRDSLPANSAVALAFDHSGPTDVLYAATEDPAGLFYSYDHGESWTDLADRKYMPWVRRLQVNGGWLYAVPEDGGVWIRGAVATHADPKQVRELPDAIALSQNFPNPFRTTTTVRYDLAVSTKVRMTVFDLLGRTVVQLVDGVQTAGSHEVTVDGSGLRSGVYVLQVEAGGASQTRTLVLLR